MKTKTLEISGMNCNHCVLAVKNALTEIPHLHVENVSIGSAVLQYDEASVPMEAIAEAIREAGFTLVAAVE